MNVKTIRTILRNTFGTRCYRITRDGEIHVFGAIPNTNQTGWYLFGWIGDSITETHINQL